MLVPDFLNQAAQLADEASIKAEEYSGAIGPIKAFIIENFGQNGLYATYIALAVIILFVVSKVAKLTFSTLKYLVIPALGLAFIASLFLPLTFAAALPATVTLCSLFLILKG